MNFEELLEKQDLRDRYAKVRQFFSLKESAYDISSACQLRCDGCYYFEGDKYKVTPERELDNWKRFFHSERERGINFANVAGAEPALRPNLLKICNDIIPCGTVFTNGLRRIEGSINYRVHVSIWGGKDGDPKYRRRASGISGEFCLPVQLKNYKSDERVIFVYTFNSQNIDEIDEVLPLVAESGHQLTFNVFSPPRDSETRLSISDLQLIKRKIFNAIRVFPRAIVYSFYNAEVHTDAASLFKNWGCPYPRASQGPAFGISTSFRSYRVDLSHQKENDCCIPDTACDGCRHYAAGSAIVTSKLKRHCINELMFRKWLDYVDTYLAVFVLGYRKSPNLYCPETQDSEKGELPRVERTC
jgi:sulfatase maturation enzyme AslB (radical SAM superfamily)